MGAQDPPYTPSGLGGMMLFLASSICFIRNLPRSVATRPSFAENSELTTGINLYKVNRVSSGSESMRSFAYSSLILDLAVNAIAFSTAKTLTLCRNDFLFEPPTKIKSALLSEDAVLPTFQHAQKLCTKTL